MIIVRKASFADFEGIVECRKSVRGGEYYGDAAYDVAQLQNDTTEQAFVAVDDKNTVVGSISIMRNIFGKTTNVIGMLAVKKEFTGLGIASRLLCESAEFTARQDIPSAKVHIVTTHDIVQRKDEKLGFIPCGFLFAVRDNNRCVPEEKGVGPKRSLIVYTKKVNLQDAGTLYLDDSLKPLAAGIYARLDAKFKTAQSIVPSGQSDIEVLCDAHHSVTYLKIVTCGKDLAKRIESIKADCAGNPLHTMTAFLNINSPTAEAGFHELVAQGFAFAGFDPLGEEFEGIIMIYKGNVDLSLDEMKLSDQSRRLLSEVVKLGKFE